MSQEYFGVPFDQVTKGVEEISLYLFGLDPSVRSVGITRVQKGFGYRVVRNSKTIFAALSKSDMVSDFEGVPVIYDDVPSEVEALVNIPAPGITAANTNGTIPERLRQRDLICGLQIQNFDDDVREGILPKQMVVGTLGCFVTLKNGARALLSNNHVVAAENRGQRGSDSIFQPGCAVHSAADQIAVLADYEPLVFIPPGTTLADQFAFVNVIDAGIAIIDSHIQSIQGFDPVRNLSPPAGIALPTLGETVFKVGRTTGLTYGEVRDVDVRVNQVHYPSGSCCFEQSFIVETNEKQPFSAGGDSGSIILNQFGEVLGLLYATNGTQTYVCPIGQALQRFSCTLASP